MLKATNWSAESKKNYRYNKKPQFFLEKIFFKKIAVFQLIHSRIQFTIEQEINIQREDDRYEIYYTWKTGLQVSVVGLGGIPVQRTDKNGAVEIVEACMKQGVNYLDTARGYTVSEEFFGEAIKPHRDKWILATKSMSRDYEGMKADIETSLRNLQTDYIDLYQIHNIKTDEEFELCFGGNGAYKALLEAKEAGRLDTSVQPLMVLKRLLA